MLGTVRYMALNTTPITNVIQWDRSLLDLYSKEYFSCCPFLRTTKDIRDYYESKLGKPTFGVMAGKRISVWVMEDGSAMLFSKRGMGFEVKQGSTPEQAYDSWQKFYQKVAIE